MYWVFGIVYVSIYTIHDVFVFVFRTLVHTYSYRTQGNLILRVSSYFISELWNADNESDHFFHICVWFCIDANCAYWGHGVSSIKLNINYLHSVNYQILTTSTQKLGSSTSRICNWVNFHSVSFSCLRYYVFIWNGSSTSRAVTLPSCTLRSTFQHANSTSLL